MQWHIQVKKMVIKLIHYQYKRTKPKRHGKVHEQDNIRLRQLFAFITDLMFIMFYCNLHKKKVFRIQSFIQEMVGAVVFQIVNINLQGNQIIFQKSYFFQVKEKTQ
ncbi:hypothetical protein IMG5_119880 [Ichthyophthirius multifiliis]|uniref:Uncharacterized protein n=1 Tax=Ichthyophthirius multifiliis TaxID=5932 RepID=G0QUW8_ICHMU|nr:hypothetical protein IMG5_119880 [Ichthyophthirius multifiliis]EGR30973.1 hypothetical protein IMG5_119880 [Ichthyophthirius multifiliis]|eukprot:XP_004034459.1 hypothetical protein IMG5_119880 [Ichthyophthirius multifiliis]